jgi:Na+-driven multidrug efflux pump
MTAVKTLLLSLLFYMVFLEWGKQGSAIAGLTLMIILLIVMIIDVFRHKEKYVQLYNSFNKLMEFIFKKVK